MQELKSLLNFVEHQRSYQNNCAQQYPIKADMIHTIECFLNDVVQDNAFCMCVKMEALRQIIETDVFKNQMELTKGTTMGGSQARAVATKALFGVDTTCLLPQEYPKYGLLLSQQKTHDLYCDMDMIFHYGSVIVTFKKEAVFYRTTMCVGNSLNFGEYQYKCPTYVKEPRYTCIRIQQGTQEILSFYNHIINHQLKSDAPYTLLQVYERIAGYENYELQYHGELKLSSDVAKIELFPINDQEEALFQILTPRMEAYGISCTVLDTL